MSEIIIYGASDDLVEVEGAVRDEYYVGSDSSATLVLEAPDREQLEVNVAFGWPDAKLDWSIAIGALNSYPSWPFHFGARPGDEGPGGDPAVFIDAPEGTTVRNKFPEPDED